MYVCIACRRISDSLRVFGRTPQDSQKALWSSKGFMTLGKLQGLQKVPWLSEGIKPIGRPHGVVKAFSRLLTVLRRPESLWEVSRFTEGFMVFGRPQCPQKMSKSSESLKVFEGRRGVQKTSRPSKVFNACRRPQGFQEPQHLQKASRFLRKFFTVSPGPLGTLESPIGESRFSEGWPKGLWYRTPPEAFLGWLREYGTICPLRPLWAD